MASPARRFWGSEWAGRLDRLASLSEPGIVSFIESKPNVMMGKPVITGTRITVESIQESLITGRLGNKRAFRITRSPR